MSDRKLRIFSRTLGAAALVLAGHSWVFGGQFTMSNIGVLEREIAAERTEIAVMQAEIDSLRAWGDSLSNDPWVVERVARERYGLIRDGETLVRFVHTER